MRANPTHICVLKREWVNDRILIFCRTWPQLTSVHLFQSAFLFFRKIDWFFKFYNQHEKLITQMRFYNNGFDARRFWAYGCNCLILGDRPMSDAGLGPPVDELDSSCKRYKECLKCAQMEFGEDCVNELKKYKFLAKGDDVKCRNRANTCERSLCECDKLLAQQHSSRAETWDQQYHLFWGENWSPEERCKKSPKARTQTRECCNAPKNGAAYAMFNPNRQECCPSGEVATIGECWPWIRTFYPNLVQL